jgi:hypothetical protein
MVRSGNSFAKHNTSWCKHCQAANCDQHERLWRWCHLVDVFRIPQEFYDLYSDLAVRPSHLPIEARNTTTEVGWPVYLKYVCRSSPLYRVGNWFDNSPGNLLALRSIFEPQRQFSLMCWAHTVECTNHAPAGKNNWAVVNSTNCVKLHWHFLNNSSD